MRKKFETRFPAGRIKKIMQADEDVGKIALAVPVLVSKALEMFLQDLCDKTYDITVDKGVKTVSSLHLKQCVHSNIMFDFLKDVVSKVPDLRGFDAGGEDKSSKRRKTVDESNANEEDLKRYRIEETGAGSSRGRGRPRGRPKGSGRGGNRDSSCFGRYVDDPKSAEEASDTEEQLKEIDFGRDFDLNLDYMENLKVLGTDMAADYDETKRKEHFDMDNRPSLLNAGRSSEEDEEEEEEDYDNEED